MKIATHSPGVLETHLRKTRGAGRKILVPYITGGLTGWIDAIRGAVANGADAIEIGIPFSDPVMDGPIIQMASEKALRDGATPISILQELRTVDVAVPLIVMCSTTQCSEQAMTVLRTLFVTQGLLQQLFQIFL